MDTQNGKGHMSEELRVLELNKHMGIGKATNESQTCSIKMGLQNKIQK